MPRNRDRFDEGLSLSIEVFPLRVPTLPPASSETPSGILYTAARGTTTCSDSPPPQPTNVHSACHRDLIELDLPLKPTKPLLSQQLMRPSLQATQVPSYMMGCTATRSPTLTSSTSSPTSSITPLNSWPNVRGSFSLVIGWAVIGMMLAPPRYSWRSVLVKMYCYFPRGGGSSPVPHIPQNAGAT